MYHVAIFLLVEVALVHCQVQQTQEIECINKGIRARMLQISSICAMVHVEDVSSTIARKRESANDHNNRAAVLTSLQHGKMHCMPDRIRRAKARPITRHIRTRRMPHARATNC